VKEIALWDGSAPGSESWAHAEIEVTSIPLAPGAVRNVASPTLASYSPPDASDRAVIVVPGGAFHLLSMQNEGHDVARHLVGCGLAAHVLKYRVVPTPVDDDGFHRALAAAVADGMESAIASTLALAVADAERAVEVARRQGADHVTLLGFSAGGRIVAEIATGRGRFRPDAAATVYASHVPAPEAPDDAPPLFVVAAADDPLVGLDGSLHLHELWRAAGRPVELHVFERGGHGFGMVRQGLPVDSWPHLFTSWLDARN